MQEYFKNPVSEFIWNDKYKADEDKNIQDTWNRVARALSSNEPKEKDKWYKKFRWALQDFKVLPGGRVLANAGVKAKHSSTLVNCFVSPEIEDSMESIFDMAKQAALTLKSGGGIGFDFSKIRPKGSTVIGINQGQASGPVSFMGVFDRTCKTVMAGNRRGAMIGVLRIDHPDIELFINCKDGTDHLSSMNISVAITNTFMKAVEGDKEFKLKFEGEVYETVQARDLFDKIIRHTYEYSEPGVIFIDTVNKLNNLYWTETINASNPCGEQVMGHGGSCNLISINLTKIISNPFTQEAAVDYEELEKLTRIAVRMADNVVDVSSYPLELYKKSAHDTRRIGIGITGLADSFVMLGYTYDSHDAVRISEDIMNAIKEAAYDESCNLAEEKGPFPLFVGGKYLKSNFIKTLSKDLQDKIRDKGIRNSHLLSIQPTGTVSLLANNISSGLEPIFSLSYKRKIKGRDQQDLEFELKDFAYHNAQKYWQKTKIERIFTTVEDLTIDAHVDIQAVLQKHIDASISKTINVPTEFDYEEFKDVYFTAWESDLKGVTTFRPTERLAGIIQDGSKQTKAKVAFERGYILNGKTYKIKDPNQAHAYYVTINDINDPSGKEKLWEIFFNSKSEENDQFVKALSVLLSEVFKRVDDPKFIADALQMISDSSGGFWDDGKFYRSLVARIGYTILQHLQIEDAGNDAVTINGIYGFCPVCSQKRMIRKEGCEECHECGYSKCI